MRIVKMLLMLCFLALFLFSASIPSAAAEAGEVLYRQSFSDLSNLANAGIAKGSDGAEGFELLLDGELVINNLTDRRSYTVLPYELPSEDHTIAFSFSFDRTDAANAYIGFMLTCRGDEPDNITSVVIRANGECEGFGTLDDELVENMASGERVDVEIPVKSGDYYELTVSSGGITDTMSRKTVGGIPKGRIGFTVRRAAVRLYEISVISGIGSSAHADTADDTWSDSRPYALTPSEERYLAAPQTSDELVLSLAALVSAAVLFVLTARQRQK